MNDEQMQSVLDEWFEDTDPQPPNAQRTTTHVMARVPQTRQRGRWLPFRLLRPKAQTPTATDTAEYQPSPLPATNGHTPTVIGRTQSMLSPVKAITAGAIVFALGGVLLIAQPFDQQGANVPGAATDVDALRPALITGTIEHHNPSWETGRVEVSDPRLTGDVTLDETLESIPDPIVPDIEGLDAGEFARFGAELYWGSIRIENDAGAWEGQFVCAPTVATHGFEDPCLIELTGVDAYEGLSAVLVEGNKLDIAGSSNDTFMLDGLIFNGNLPPDR